MSKVSSKRGSWSARRKRAYFFLPLLLLELLLLELLFELELDALFFEPLELEPDLVGMALSFPRQTVQALHSSSVGESTKGYVPLLFSPNI
jgi:hypothetical protein